MSPSHASTGRVAPFTTSWYCAIAVSCVLREAAYTARRALSSPSCHAGLDPASSPAFAPSPTQERLCLRCHFLHDRRGGQHLFHQRRRLARDHGCDVEVPFGTRLDVAVRLVVEVLHQ